jgi:hypothetical protein
MEWIAPIALLILLTQGAIIVRSKRRRGLALAVGDREEASNEVFFPDSCKIETVFGSERH